MSTFYVLPSRPFVGQSFARYLQGVFPGLGWDGPARDNLADGIAAAAECHRDVHVVFREELADEADLEGSLREGFGADPGDDIVEVRAGTLAGAWAVRRWRVGGRAAA